MEVEHLQRNCNENHDTLLLCQSCGSENKLRNDCLDPLPKKQAGCSHFSIRGYVNKVRLCDRRICCPFHEFHNYGDTEKHCLLPPMHVPDFRWWDCKSCSEKNVSKEATYKQRGSRRKLLPCKVKVKGIFLDGNPTMESHATQTRFLPQHQVASEKVIHNGVPVDYAYNTHTTEIDIPCQPKWFGSTGEQESAKDITRKEDQVQRKGKNICVVTDGTMECTRGVKNMTPMEETVCSSERNKSFSILDFSRPGNNLNIGYYSGNPSQRFDGVLNSTEKCSVVPMQRETHYEQLAIRSIHKHGEKDPTIPNKSSENRGPQNSKLGSPFSGKNSYMLKRKGKKLINGHKADSKPLKSLKQKHDVLKRKNLIGQRSLQHKKAQKTRMLNDIMKSEVLGISKSVPAASSKENLDQLDATTMKIDAFKEESTHRRRRLNDSLQKEKGKTPKNKNGWLLLLKGKGSYLKHSPNTNRIPEKIKSIMLDAESKPIEQASRSKSTNTMSTLNVVDSNSKICGSKQGHSVETKQDKKHIIMTQTEVGKKKIVPFKMQEDGKRSFVVDDCSGKLNPKLIPSNSARVLGKRTLHPQPILNGSPCKNGSMNDKQSKSIQNVIGNHHPINVTKDSLEISNKGNIHSPKVGQSIPEKLAAQKSNQMGDTADVDGVPVEILKLLQENWLKKHIVNGESPNKEMEEAPVQDMKEERSLKSADNVENVELAGFPYQAFQNPHSKPCDIQRDRLSAIRDEQVGPCSQPYRFPSGAGFAGKSIDNSYYEMNFHANSKSKHHTVVHHDKFHVVSESRKPPAFREKQENGRKHTFINFKGDYFPETYRMAMQSADTYKGGAISFQDTCSSYSFNVPSLPKSSATIAGTDFPKFPSYPNCIDKSSQNRLLGQNIRDVEFEMRHTKATKNRKRTLQDESISYFSEVDGYSNRVMPKLDLHNNDAFSAMHLLSLMDPAVCSNPSPCSLMAQDQKIHDKHRNISYFDKRIEGYTVGTNRVMSQQMIHASGSENFSHYNPRMISNSLLVSRSGFSGSLFPKDKILSSDGYGYRPPLSYSNCYGEAKRFPSDYSGQEQHSSPYYLSQTRPTLQTFTCDGESAQPNLLSLLNYASHSKTSLANGESPIGRDEYTQVVGSANKNCQIQSCVVNRNPADFTLPNEDNEYMIGYDNLLPKESLSLYENGLSDYRNNQRPQKAMKLTALKGFLRN